MPQDRFETKLSPSEEQAFQRWRGIYAPKDSGVDYDLRGAFAAGLAPDPVTGHWPDTFKKPNHPTFSVESIYAPLAPGKAGRWENGNYIPAGGRQVGVSLKRKDEPKKKSLARRIFTARPEVTGTELGVSPESGQVEPVTATARGAPYWLSAAADFATSFGGGVEAAAQQQQQRAQALQQRVQEALEPARHSLRATMLRQKMTADEQQLKLQQAQILKLTRPDVHYASSPDGSAIRVINEDKFLAGDAKPFLDIPWGKATADELNAANRDLLSTVPEGVKGRPDFQGRYAAKIEEAHRLAQLDPKKAASIVPDFLNDIQKEHKDEQFRLGQESRSEAAANRRQDRSFRHAEDMLIKRAEIPTAQTRAMGQQAGAVRTHTATILDLINKIGDEKLGPVAGRMNEFMAGTVGAGDPDFTRLRTNLSLMRTGLMRAHVGARGGVQLLSVFDSLVSSTRMTPAMLRAAVGEIDSWLAGYEQAGKVGQAGESVSEGETPKGKSLAKRPGSAPKSLQNQDPLGIK